MEKNAYFCASCNLWVHSNKGHQGHMINTVPEAYLTEEEFLEEWQRENNNLNVPHHHYRSPGAK